MYLSKQIIKDKVEVLIWVFYFLTHRFIKMVKQKFKAYH